MSEKPRLIHGRFYFGDWSSPDPDDKDLHLALEAAYPGHHDNDPVTISREDAYRIHAAVNAYLHFAGHPAPNISILPQLAKLRAAVRAHRREPK